MFSFLVHILHFRETVWLYWVLNLKLFFPLRKAVCCVIQTVEEQNEALLWYVLLWLHAFPTNHWRSWCLNWRGKKKHFYWTIAPPSILIVFVLKIQRYILFMLIKKSHPGTRGQTSLGNTPPPQLWEGGWRGMTSDCCSVPVTILHSAPAGWRPAAFSLQPVFPPDLHVCFCLWHLDCLLPLYFLSFAVSNLGIFPVGFLEIPCSWLLVATIFPP